MTGTSWICTECTYYHSFKAERCAMCSQYRVSKTEMINFIQGKPIMEKSLRSSNAVREDAIELDMISPSEVGIIDTGMNTRVHDHQIPTLAPSSSSSIIQTNGMNPSNDATVYLTSNQKSITKSFNPYHKAVLRQSLIHMNHTDSKNLVEVKAGFQKNNIQNDSISYSESSSEHLQKQPENTTMVIMQSPIHEESTAVKTRTTNASTTSTTTITTAVGVESTKTKTAAVEETTTMVDTFSRVDEPSTTKAVQLPNHTNPYKKKSSIAGPSAPQKQQQRLLPTAASKTNIVSSPRRSVGPTTSESNTLINHYLVHTKVGGRASTTTYHPGPVPLDEDMAQTWIFPQSDSYRERKYQLDICQSGKKTDLIYTIFCLF